MKQVQSNRRGLLGNLAAWCIGILLGCSFFANVGITANGAIYVLPCSTCNAVDDFAVSAKSAASGAAAPGTYVVSSLSTPRTGYVRVTGTVKQVCQPQSGDCTYILLNPVATVLGEQGTAVGGVGDLELVDTGLFGVARSNSIPVLNIRDSYSSSFIGSTDEEVSPGIGRALLDLGINQGGLQIGTVVMVKFTDGTQAQFRRFCAVCSWQWEWTGKAWDKDGKPITRSGTLVSNPNTGGTGRGGGRYPRGGDYVDVGGPDTLNWYCRTWTTVSIGGQVVSTHSSTVPC